MKANKFLCYMFSFLLTFLALTMHKPQIETFPLKKFRCSVNIKTIDSNFCKAGLRRKLKTTAT